MVDGVNWGAPATDL